MGRRPLFSPLLSVDISVVALIAAFVRVVIDDSTYVQKLYAPMIWCNFRFGTGAADTDIPEEAATTMAKL